MNRCSSRGAFSPSAFLVAAKQHKNLVEMFTKSQDYERSCFPLDMNSNPGGAGDARAGAPAPETGAHAQAGAAQELPNCAQNLADICVNPRIMMINAGRPYALLKFELTFLGLESERT